MARERRAAAPKTTEQLVLVALKAAAKKPQTRWSGATGSLFNPAEQNAEAAIAVCTTGEHPLLKKDGDLGSLTPAGFCRLVELTPKAKVADAVTGYAAVLDIAGRRAMYSALKSRTSGDGAELFYEAIRAFDAEDVRRQNERAAEMRQLKLDGYRATIEANKQTERRLAQELSEIRAETRGLEATVREMEAAKPEPPPTAEAEPARKPLGHGPEPKTREEKDFRRSECDRLAAAWRDALAAGKLEGAEFLETAMYNIRGLRMIGETDAKVKFDGRIHESDGPAFTDDAVRVVRPGWLLKTDDEEYTALKAAVTPV